MFFCVRLSFLCIFLTHLNIDRIFAIFPPCKVVLVPPMKHTASVSYRETICLWHSTFIVFQMKTIKKRTISISDVYILPKTLEFALTYCLLQTSSELFRWYAIRWSKYPRSLESNERKKTPFNLYPQLNLHPVSIKVSLHDGRSESLASFTNSDRRVHATIFCMR